MYKFDRSASVSVHTDKPPTHSQIFTIKQMRKRGESKVKIARAMRMKIDKIINVMKMEGIE